MAWLTYTFLFFSVAKNKLPGYALPMMPPLAIVLAVAVDKAGATARWWLLASVMMLGALPAIAAALPEALLSGVRKAPFVFGPGLSFILPAALVWWLAWRERSNLAMIAAGLSVVFGCRLFENENVSDPGRARFRARVLARESSGRERAWKTSGAIGNTG